MRTPEEVEYRAAALRCGDNDMTYDMLMEYANLLREQAKGAQGEAVAEVYEHPNYNYGPIPRMRTYVRFLGVSLPTGTKLYTKPRAAVPDDRLQKAIDALLWVNEEVWPLAHGLTCRETLKKRFRELPDLIEYLAKHKQQE